MIRHLHIEDLDVLYSLRQQALRNHPRAFGAYPDEESREWMAARMAEKDDEDFILGYFDRDELAGMVGFKREQKLKKKHKGWIWGMYVDPEHQGKGIARKLMNACVKKAGKIDGLKIILISVTHVSVPAHNLYEHLGFEVWGVEPNALVADGEKLNEVFLRLAL